MKWHLVYWAFYVLTGASVMSERQPAHRDHELHLVNLLFNKTHYDKAVSPSIPVNVSLQIYYQEITNLDERYQVLHSFLKFYFVWTDPHFRWDPQKFGGVRRLFIDPTEIWTPDIIIYNSVAEESLGTDVFAETPVIIQSNGLVKWDNPAVVRTSCRVHVAMFPFDIQKCPIITGSWSRSMQYLRLLHGHNIPEGMKVSSYDNEEWQLMDVQVEEEEYQYNCCKLPYSIIKYTLVMRRKSFFFIFNYMMPCGFLMAVGIAVFLLPPGDFNKTSIAMTLLLTLTLFQVTISNILPRSSDGVPVLSQFLCVSVTLMAVITAASIMCIAFFARGPRGVPPPAWFYWVLSGWGAAILGIAGPTVNKVLRMLKRDSSAGTRTTTKAQATDPIFSVQWNTMKVDETKPDVVPKRNGPATDRQFCEPLEPSRNSAAVHRLLHEPVGPNRDGAVIHRQLCETVSKIYQHILYQHQKKERRRACELAWHLVSLILERSLCILLSFASVVAMVIVFSQVT